MAEALVPFEKPFLWEILLLIFDECDPSTLAALGAVSMDSLVATSPLLYRNVSVRFAEQMEMLFCKRTPATASPNSRINRFLNLSLLQTLSIDFTSPTFPPTSALHPSPSRIISTSGLHLDTLTITCDHWSKITLPLLHRSLLPHLNPTRLEYDVRGPRTGATFVIVDTPLLLNFTRLEELVVKGTIVYRLQRSTVLLASLPAPSLERRRVVRLHLHSLFDREASDAASFLRMIRTEWKTKLFLLAQMEEGTIVLVVETEGMRVETQRALRSEVRQKWRGRFVVELEKRV